MRRAAWGILSACVVLAASGAASAQGGDSPDSVAKRDAQARFEEGIARVRGGDLEGALVSFRMAWAAAPTPAVLWNLALTEQKTHHDVDALGHFREYLRLAQPTDPYLVTAHKHIDELKAATGHIAIAAPAGALLKLDANRVLGEAPLQDPADVEPGRHVVEAALAGVTHTLTVDAPAGQTTRAEFTGANGFATVGAGAGAGAGATAPQSDGSAPPPSPAGPDGASRPAAEAPATAQGEYPPARLITVVSVGSAAVFTAGLALAFGIASSNDADTANTLRQQNPSCSAVAPTPGCQQLADTTSAQHNTHQVSTGLWWTAGGLAVVGAGLFLFWPRSSSAPAPVATGTPAVRVAPALGAGMFGVNAQGTF